MYINILKAKILMWLAQWGMILDGIVGVITFCEVDSDLAVWLSRKALDAARLEERGKKWRH